MKVMSVLAGRTVVRELGLDDPSPRSLMVAPRALSMRSREVGVSRNGTYERLVADWRGGTVVLERNRDWNEPTGADPATVAAVRSTVRGERFLRWARFPYFVPGTGSDSGTIFVGDARYSAGTEESWAGVRVRPNAQEVAARR